MQLPTHVHVSQHAYDWLRLHVQVRLQSLHTLLVQTLDGILVAGHK